MGLPPRVGGPPVHLCTGSHLWPLKQWSLGRGWEEAGLDPVSQGVGVRQPGTPPKKVAGSRTSLSQGSKALVSALLDQPTSFSKLRFTDKIVKNFKTTRAEL